MVDPITGPMSTFEYNFHCEKHKVKLENYFNSESFQRNIGILLKEDKYYQVYNQVRRLHQLPK